MSTNITAAKPIRNILRKAAIHQSALNKRFAKRRSPRIGSPVLWFGLRRICITVFVKFFRRKLSQFSSMRIERSVCRRDGRVRHLDQDQLLRERGVLT